MKPKNALLMLTSHLSMGVGTSTWPIVGQHLGLSCGDYARDGPHHLGESLGPIVNVMDTGSAVRNFWRWYAKDGVQKSCSVNRSSAHPVGIIFKLSFKLGLKTNEEERWESVLNERMRFSQTSSQVWKYICFGDLKYEGGNNLYSIFIVSGASG